MTVHERVRISAVICTLNRASYLRKAIESLVRQTVSTDQYEILVVDNGSTDNTKQVVGEFFYLPNVRYVYEPILGLAHARNAGWRQARGNYVAYLDDDGIACATWLERILEVFQLVKPTPGCVGGKVEPIWEAPRPAWLSDELALSLSVINWGNSPTVLGKDQYLAGVNFAFPKRILKKLGGFRAELGRRGRGLLSNEEVLIERQIQKLGMHCWYDPKIAVAHHVSASRLDQAWFARRYYWQGISDVVLEQILSGPDRKALLKDAWRDLKPLLRALSGGYFSPRKIYWHFNNLKFPHWIESVYTAGRIRERLSLAIHPRRMRALRS